MRLLRLVVTMLRYRAASLVVLFFLLGAALQTGLNSFRWQYVAGVVALLACYVVATSLNDVFDVEVDRVNHPGAHDRPLVTGAATVRRLVAMAAVLALVATIASAAVGPLAFVAVIVSLLVNIAYSAPPLRLCARPLAAAPVLAFAYVALPFTIGLASAGATLTWLDAPVMAAFMTLFVARMLLKDFRDRAGDAAQRKWTFLLRYGKEPTLRVVLVCVVAGDLLLVTALPKDTLLVLVIETYFVALFVELLRLSRATSVSAELAAIARGARMGNAVVLTWLGFILLRSAGAGAATVSAFVVALAAVYWAAYVLPATAAATPAASTREASTAEAARAS